jgi:hypothetical protein
MTVKLPMPLAMNRPILSSARLAAGYGFIGLYCCVYDVLKIIVLSFDMVFFMKGDRAY